MSSSWLPGIRCAPELEPDEPRPQARRAARPWAGFHTLRHTCATLLFGRGLNAKQAQVWLGHHSPAFTLETHVHLLSDDLPPNISILDGLPDPADHKATIPAVRSGEMQLAAARSNSR